MLFLDGVSARQVAYFTKIPIWFREEHMDELIKDKIVENMTANLPTLRAKATLSQAKLAEMVGVSRQTLVAVENRKRKMSWSTFLACFLIFHKNEETNTLLKLYEIYTDELDEYLTGVSEPDSLKED